MSVPGDTDWSRERWTLHEREHHQHDQAHQREHNQTEQAIGKAEANTKEALLRSQQVIDERFSATNEWRAAFSDRERAFMTKAEYTSGHDAMLARLDRLEDSDLTRTTREAERERATLRTMALIGLVAAVGGFLLSLLARLLNLG